MKPRQRTLQKYFRWTPESPRKCQLCKQTKPLKEFAKAPKYPGGHGYQCNECARDRILRRLCNKISIDELKRRIANNDRILRIQKEVLQERENEMGMGTD